MITFLIIAAIVFFCSVPVIENWNRQTKKEEKEKAYRLFDFEDEFLTSSHFHAIKKPEAKEVKMYVKKDEHIL